jgi:hypothetical protein
MSKPRGYMYIHHEIHCRKLMKCLICLWIYMCVWVSSQALLPTGAELQHRGQAIWVSNAVTHIMKFITENLSNLIAIFDQMISYGASLWPQKRIYGLSCLFFLIFTTMRRQARQWKLKQSTSLSPILHLTMRTSVDVQCKWSTSILSQNRFVAEHFLWHFQPVRPPFQRCPYFWVLMSTYTSL